MFGGGGGEGVDDVRYRGETAGGILSLASFSLPGA